MLCGAEFSRRPPDNEPGYHRGFCFDVKLPPSRKETMAGRDVRRFVGLSREVSACMRSPRYLALLLWEVLMNTKWIAAVLAALFVGGPATAEPAPSRYGNHDGPAHARSPNGPAKRQAQSRTARVTEAHGRPKAPTALISRDALPSLPHPSAEPPRKQADARGAKPWRRHRSPIRRRRRCTRLSSPRAVWIGV